MLLRFSVSPMLRTISPSSTATSLALVVVSPACDIAALLRSFIVVLISSEERFNCLVWSASAAALSETVVDDCSICRTILRRLSNIRTIFLLMLPISSFLAVMERTFAMSPSVRS